MGNRWINSYCTLLCFCRECACRRLVKCIFIISEKIPPDMRKANTSNSFYSKTHRIWKPKHFCRKARSKIDARWFTDSLAYQRSTISTSASSWRLRRISRSSWCRPSPAYISCTVGGSESSVRDKLSKHRSCWKAWSTLRGCMLGYVLIVLLKLSRPEEKLGCIRCKIRMISKD